MKIYEELSANAFVWASTRGIELDDQMRSVIDDAKELWKADDKRRVIGDLMLGIAVLSAKLGIDELECFSEALSRRESMVVYQVTGRYVMGTFYDLEKAMDCAMNCIQGNVEIRDFTGRDGVVIYYYEAGTTNILVKVKGIKVQ